MDFKHFKAGKDDNGRRLDKIIRRFLDESNLSSIYKTLRNGLIKVNGKKQTADFRITEGDDISIADFLLIKNEKKESSKNEKVIKPLDDKIIIFRNENILFINKPYDIPVQPAKDFNSQTLSELVENDYSFYHKQKESLSFKTGPLHRLDRKTTGLIAFSQSLLGANLFSEMMQNHNLKKIYLGIVIGKLEKKQIWKNKIEKKESETSKTFHTVKIFDEKTTDGKYSYTEATPLAYGKYNEKDVTLVQFLITTGRTHQIRAQAANNGFALLGDTAYGSFPIISCGRDFFLHAYKIEFEDLENLENLEQNNLEKINEIDNGIEKNYYLNSLNIPYKIKAPLDKSFIKMLDKIGINNNFENLIK